MKLDLATMAQGWRWQNSIRLIPWLVLAAGLSSTYILQREALDSARQSHRARFDLEVRDISIRLDQRLLAYRQILRGVSGLFTSSKSVNRDEFRQYVADLRLSKNYPGIQGIGHAVLIPPQKKAGFIDAVRKEGFPDYDIKPEGERGVYAPIIYLEPFSGNNIRAFGYDLYSERVRREAMEQARDMNQTTMTGKIRLVQETSRQASAGFLMVLPVYRKNSPHTTLAERHANVVGWVYAAFRMNDLMGGLFGEHGVGIDLEIFDGATPTPETLMYDHDNQLLSLTNVSLFKSSHSTQILGRNWTINLCSLPAFEAQLDTRRAAVIGLGGSLVSVLLSLLMGLLINQRARAIRLAATMTLELQQSENDLKEVVAELQYQKYALDQHAIVATTDIKGTITYANEKFSQISGYKQYELIGQNHRLINSGVHPQSFFKDMYRTIAAGEVWYGEICNRAKDGSLYWVLTTIVPFKDANDKVSQYIAIRSDITRNKLADARLKEALQEKEALLKEVYHRVKNNLQVVSSLINLQATTVENEEALVLLKQSADRIKAMALLHEKLYQSKDLAKININEYCRSLVDHLLFGYGIDPDKVKVNYQTEELFLDVDMAIPCGLIINELITNALKHAFPSGLGEITVGFSQDQAGVYTLIVGDSGIGLPIDFDIETCHSLGMQLVSTLAQQLMGRLILDKKGGTTVTIRFLK